MKVAVYQTSPVLLDLKANLEDVISKIHQGREKGAHLIVFPELALTGYFVGQRYHKMALKMDSKEIKQLASATKGTAAVVGFIEESQSMNFYNSALVAVDGEILFAYRKLNRILPCLISVCARRQMYLLAYSVHQRAPWELSFLILRAGESLIRFTHAFSVFITSVPIALG